MTYPNKDEAAGYRELIIFRCNYCDEQLTHVYTLTNCDHIYCEKCILTYPQTKTKCIVCAQKCTCKILPVNDTNFSSAIALYILRPDVISSFIQSYFVFIKKQNETFRAFQQKKVSLVVEYKNKINQTLQIVQEKSKKALQELKPHSTQRIKSISSNDPTFSSALYPHRNANEMPPYSKASYQPQPNLLSQYKYHENAMETSPRTNANYKQQPMQASTNYYSNAVEASPYSKANHQPPQNEQMGYYQNTSASPNLNANSCIPHRLSFHENAEKETSNINYQNQLTLTNCEHQPPYNEVASIYSDAGHPTQPLERPKYYENEEMRRKRRSSELNRTEDNPQKAERSKYKYPSPANSENMNSGHTHKTRASELIMDSDYRTYSEKFDNRT